MRGRPRSRRDSLRAMAMPMVAAGGTGFLTVCGVVK